MRTDWLSLARSKEGEWQIDNTLFSLLVAIGLAIVIGVVGHVFAISY